MAIIIKELVIKGKVVRDLQDVKMEDGLTEAYLNKIKRSIVESCKQQIREELERELMK